MAKEIKYVTTNKTSDDVPKEEKSAKLTQMVHHPREMVDLAAFFRNEPESKSRRDLLTAYHNNPAFFAVANKISNDISSTLFKGTDFDTREKVLDASVLADLAKNPSSYMSPASFWKIVSIYHEVLGEATIIIDDEPDDPQRVVDLIPVPPTACTLEQNGQDVLFWRVDFNHFQRKVPLDRMMVWKSPHAKDPFGRGKGLGHALSSEIEIEEYAAKHEASELYNHNRPDFIAHGVGMDEDARQAFKKAWNENFSGPDNRGKPLFTSSESGGEGSHGEIQIHELSRPLKDLGMTELRKFSQDVIRQTFGVPPEILGVIENSNKATISAAKKFYAENTLVPRLESLCSEFTRTIGPLLQAKGERLDYESPIPPDIETKQSIMKDHPNCFTINEIRAIAGEPPIEGGEEMASAKPAPTMPLDESKGHSHLNLVKKKSTESSVAYLKVLKTRMS